MFILGIDTSCDDTCIAILEITNWKLEIRSNIVSSQVKIHRKYGGVYPTLAKREHQRNLIPVVKKALKESNFLSEKLKVKSKKLHLKIQNLNKILERDPFLYRELKKFLIKYQKPRIDLIAVTVGPGLEPCLWQGVNFAKALSFFWEIPIIPVNHIEGHITANLLSRISSNLKLKTKSEKSPPIPQLRWVRDKQLKIKIFPAICLIVSGGHTQLILMRDFGRYKILGETRDDAAGECFDKTARILGLGYPGGPAIAQLVEQWKSQIPSSKPQKNSKFQILNSKFNINLPRPMIYSKDYDFSFSGLKTAVLYDYQKRSPKIRKSRKYIQAIAKEIQQAIIDVLIAKTMRVAKEYRAKTIIFGGGVAANDELRKQFASKVKSPAFAKASAGKQESPKENPRFPTGQAKVKFFVPPKNLCTDNAAMVAVAGYYSYPKTKPKRWKEIKANANLRIS